MRHLVIFISSIVVAIINMSCEKVILIELNEADQKIVVDAVVSNDTAQNYVILSKSGGFYQSNDFEAITGANVVIADENGNTFTLTEKTPGYYTDPTLVGQLKTNYSINIVTSEQTVTGSTYIPDTTNLEGLYYFWNEGGFGKPSWFALMNWTDNVNEENFYRFKTTVNGYNEKGINVLEDLLINGIETQYPLFNTSIEDYDTLEVEFIEIDRGTYEYFKVLGEIASGENETSAAPGNPDNNLSGNALGFFGGYAITNASIVIEP